MLRLFVRLRAESKNYYYYYYQLFSKLTTRLNHLRFIEKNIRIMNSTHHAINLNQEVIYSISDIQFVKYYWDQWVITFIFQNISITGWKKMQWWLLKFLFERRTINLAEKKNNFSGISKGENNWSYRHFLRWMLCSPL